MYEKKRKLKWGRIIAIVVVFILIIVGSVAAYHLMSKDPYAQYTAYNESSKRSGTMEHTTKEEDMYYLSVYYPKYEQKVLNDAIQAYTSKIQPNQKQNKKIIMNVDYDSEDIYNAYTTVTFHQKIYDETGKELKKESLSINYDKKLDKIMSVEDVLRRDYIALLKTEANLKKVDDTLITKANLNNFILKKNAVQFYFNNNTSKSLQITYAEQKNYIAMTNKDIPSLYQKDAIIPAKEDKIDPDKPMVAFTFDDGPSQYTTQLMDAFDKQGAKATFFMVGPNAKAMPEVVADMYKRGFQMGNHTWSHTLELTRYSKKELDDEIYRTQDAIFQASGKDAAFIRAPYGSYNDDVLKASNMTMTYWSIDTEDWKSRNSEAIKKEILANLSDGSIILEHDLYPASVDAAIELLPVLKEKGYQIVTLSTLMKYKTDMLKQINLIAPSLYQ